MHNYYNNNYYYSHKIQLNDKTIEWKHLKDLYDKLMSMAVQSSGLSFVPKLKREHSNLTSFSRMRVYLAAQVRFASLGFACLHELIIQVLSKSVADAFAHFEDPATTETQIFVRNFDRMFDCLNVRSLSEWRKKKKPDLKPYTSRG